VSKDSDYVERQRLASINGLSVSFTGRRLTQVHADVRERLAMLAEEALQEKERVSRQALL
jgi:hypothetical protein